ncbi:DUF5816 domain-containing protein [Halarchaeum sp. P4]|uniref:DUF5816 domain-containing protein n=1 Tax=Halarchaeum sp. P4 TaxID=3421639 RepID=UPI003EBC52E6
MSTPALRPVTTADGESAYVDPADATRGSRAPFVPLYRDPERSDRHGWFCTGCGGADVAMDTMGRLTCGQCGNERKPTSWDAAYL